jgi:hypothetical protein
MADLITNIIRQFAPKPNLTPPARSPHWDNDPTDLMRVAQPFDVALYRVHHKEDFLGNIICHITDSPYEHAVMVIPEGYVVSADAGGIGYDDLYFGDNIIDLFRLNRSMTQDEQNTLLVRVKEAIGKPYDYWNLLDFPYLTQEQALQMSGGTSFICSELVAWIFEGIGVEFVKDKTIAKEAPADLGLSDILEYMGTFDHGKRVDGNWRNRFIGDYNNILSDFVADFMDLFSKVNQFYVGKENSKTFLVGKD